MVSAAKCPRVLSLAVDSRGHARNGVVTGWACTRTPAFDSLRSKEIGVFLLSVVNLSKCMDSKKPCPDYPQHHLTTHPLLGRAEDLYGQTFSPSFCGVSAAVRFEWETHPSHSTTAKPVFLYLQLQGALQQGSVL